MHFFFFLSQFNEVKIGSALNHLLVRFRVLAHIKVKLFVYKLLLGPMVRHYPEGVREYIGCTTNSTPQRGLGVLLKCTFLMPGVPPGVPCPIPHLKPLREARGFVYVHIRERMEAIP